MSRFLLLALLAATGVLARYGLGFGQTGAEPPARAGVPETAPSASGPLSPERFAAVFTLIKPQANESLWAKIPWLTNLHEARKKAAEEDKPLLVWRAGGGDVFGRA
jgi:hypothetical protein